MTAGAHLRPQQLMFAASSHKPPVAALSGEDGRPGKNEQPRMPAGFTLSIITSPGRYHGSSTQIRQGDTAPPAVFGAGQHRTEAVAMT